LPLPLPLSEPGPLLTFLDRLVRQARAANQPELERMTDDYRGAIRQMLSTEEGGMFLELLEKSTLLSLLPILGDERALAARNAQASIARDLRRIMSNETELVRQAEQTSAGRPRRKPAP
jgi:hypothetical protein